MLYPNLTKQICNPNIIQRYFFYTMNYKKQYFYFLQLKSPVQQMLNGTFKLCFGLYYFLTTKCNALRSAPMLMLSRYMPFAMVLLSNICSFSTPLVAVAEARYTT
jgi:hypothetical protein